MPQRQKYEQPPASPPAVSDALALAVGADDGYAVQLGVTVHSVLQHLEADSKLHLYIVDGGLSWTNRQRIERLVRRHRHVQVFLNWLRPNVDILEGLRLAQHFTVAAYFRLLLPDILPASLARVIYLDADVIAVASLRALWQEDVADVALRAVRDYGNPQMASRRGIRIHAALGYTPDHPYFNSGVMLINLDWWRRERVRERAIRYVREHHAVMNAHDQEALNALLGHHWRPLDVKWNRTTRLFSILETPPSPFRDELVARKQELLEHAAIVHLTGTKPWWIGREHPDFRLFHRYLRSSGLLRAPERWRFLWLNRNVIDYKWRTRWKPRGMQAVHQARVVLGAWRQRLLRQG